MVQHTDTPHDPHTPSLAADMARVEAACPKYIPPPGPKDQVIAELINRHAPHFKYNEAPLNPTALKSVLEDTLDARDAALRAAQLSAAAELAIRNDYHRMVSDLRESATLKHERIVVLQALIRETLEALEANAIAFEFYAREHRAKDVKGPELTKTIAKAERNEAYAQATRNIIHKIRSLLS